MSELWSRVRGGGAAAGGIVRYPLDRLYEEVAYIAIGLGWSHDEIMTLNHMERLRWVEQLNRIQAQRRMVSRNP